MELSWEHLIIYIIESVCGLVITIAIPYLLSLAKSKVKSEELSRVLDRAAHIVTDSVQLVNQTYVDYLKEHGLFNEEAQKEAFNRCKTEVLALLSKEAIQAIYETYGDFEQWLRLQIEANVSTARAHIFFPIEEEVVEETDAE